MRQLGSLGGLGGFAAIYRASVGLLGGSAAIYRALVGALGGAVLWASLVVGSVVVPGEASALVPRADRVIDAIAQANRKGRRVGALRFKLNLHIGEGPPVAIGELVTHPTGLARLELRASGGLIERHILLGNQHSAARNARVLVRPREFLPPLFVLQSNSGTVLEAALATLGVDRDIVGLAPCGDYDCFVIGDPERAVARPLAWWPAKAAPEQQSDQEQGALDQLPIHESGPPDPVASLWVDTDDYSVRQIESRSGAKIVLGPYVTFEKLSVPLWWSIEEPGKRVVRFEVEGVVEVNAAASAFSKAWLMTPDSSPDNNSNNNSNNNANAAEAGSLPSTNREIPAREAVPTSSPPPVSAPGPGYNYHPDDFVDPEAGEFSVDPSPDYDRRY